MDPACAGQPPANGPLIGPLRASQTRATRLPEAAADPRPEIPSQQTDDGHRTLALGNAPGGGPGDVERGISDEACEITAPKLGRSLFEPPRERRAMNVTHVRAADRAPHAAGNFVPAPTDPAIRGTATTT